MGRKTELGSVAIVVGALVVAGVVGRSAGPGNEARAADRQDGTLEPGRSYVGGRAAIEARRPAREAILEAVRYVRLQEPDHAVVGELTSLDRDPRGRLAVADRMSGRVTVYDSTGALLVRIGRAGEGPGEFVRPVDATFLEDGAIAVVETGRPRVTRYDPGTDSVHTFRLRGAHYGEVAARTERGLAIYVNRPDRSAPRVQVYDHRGVLVDAFHRARPEYGEVPYWSAMTKGLLAAGGGHVVAGGNLMLPFARYRTDGTFVDSIVRDLPGWEPVPRPVLGQFTGPDARRRFEAWRRTFPTLDAVEIYRDSLLVAVVERLDEEVLSTEVATYEAHVFDLESGRLVGTLDLPGRLLHADDRIHCLTGEPPAGWTIGQFALRLR